MANGDELVRRIAALVEELGAALAAAQGRGEELAAELEEARTGGDERLTAVRGELETAEKRIESLVLKLKDARQEVVEAREATRSELQEQLAAFSKAAEDARSELDQERSIRKRLEKGAAADEKRLAELERLVAERPPATPAAPAGAETSGLQAELSAALETIVVERQAKTDLEEQLAEAHKLIEALEKALKRAKELPPAPAPAGPKDQELAGKLAAVEAQLESEQRETRRHAKACADAERRIAELEQALSAGAKVAGSPAVETAAAARSAAEKPLPHEVRPAPKPGAPFRPDWDLKGLPCKSADQILQAWGSVFNVQLSLEGYPSQYCTAFLVVLKQGKQKQLYMMFNLKASKHVLVCVPSKSPEDEAALNKLVGEGEKYLQMSGFELEKIKPADVERVLGSYFRG